MLPIDKQRYKNNTAFEWDGVHLDVWIHCYYVDNNIISIGIENNYRYNPHVLWL